MFPILNFQLLFRDKGILSQDDPNDPDQLITNLRGLCKEQIVRVNNYLLATNPKRRLPDVYIDMLTCDAFGACTKKKGDCFYIAVYSADYYILLSIFYRLLSNPNLFPEIGNPALEEGPYTVYNPLVVDPHLWHIPNETMFRIPKDPDRKAVAKLLATWAVEFLVLHEYAHVLSGHVGFQEASGKDLDRILQQSLEFDADHFASSCAARERFANDPRPNVPTFSAAKTFSLWCYSLYCLFRLQGGYKLDPEKIFRSTHPPSGLRVRIAIRAAYIIKDFEKHDIDLEPVKQAIYDAEMGLRSISETKLDTSQLKFSLSEHGDNYIGLLQTIYGYTYPELEKYAFIKITFLNARSSTAQQKGLTSID